MKLASLTGGRDGRLAVVSRDLSRAALASAIAPTMQAALDDWRHAKPALAELAVELEAGRAKSVVFNSDDALAPLPRAYHWVDGSAYVNHVELVRKARGATMPESFWTDPLVYQGGSDDFLPPTADALFASEDWGIDLEGEIAVVTDDVPMGTTVEDARGHIQLVMLANDWSLRNLIPAELAKGFGFYQSKPATAFSPVAVTPDELGEAWRDARVHLPLVVPERRSVRSSQCRRRHDLRFRPAHRACGEDAASAPAASWAPARCRTATARQARPASASGACLKPWNRASR